MQGMPAVHKVQAKLLLHMLHYTGQVLRVGMVALRSWPPDQPVPYGPLCNQVKSETWAS